MQLNPVPNKSWQAEYDRLMTDGYLSKKYNRERRITDIRKYMGNSTPELKHCTGKRVLEIGPGPGEWMELCRDFGHHPVGIDGSFDEVVEMGREYLAMSRLMTERQKLKVAYIGFMAWLHDTGHPKNWFYYISSRGSIEQCFAKYMTGPSHSETKNAGGLSWNISGKLWNKFHMFFELVDRLLVDGGYLVIHANGAKNAPQYDDLVLETLKKFPNLQLYKKEGKTFHKIRKVVMG